MAVAWRLAVLVVFAFVAAAPAACCLLLVPCALCLVLDTLLRYHRTITTTQTTNTPRTTHTKANTTKKSQPATQSKSSYLSGGSRPAPAAGGEMVMVLVRVLRTCSAPLSTNHEDLPVAHQHHHHRTIHQKGAQSLPAALGIFGKGARRRELCRGINHCRQHLTDDVGIPLRHATQRKKRNGRTVSTAGHR